MSDQKEEHYQAQRGQITSLMADLDSANRKDVVVDALKTMPPAERKAVVRGLGDPDRATRNLIWKIVVWTFAAVLGLSFIATAIAMFTPQTANTSNLARPELVLSMFTSVVGFLAGIFVPSPVANSPQ
jgi:hypothetical protein